LHGKTAFALIRVTQKKRHRVAAARCGLLRMWRTIEAHSAEEAWQKMAIRFPEETDAGFTVEEWESFDVKVVQVERDEKGNIIIAA
jgi:formylmethanofuran dehydrogenase subunit E